MTALVPSRQGRFWRTPYVEGLLLVSMPDAASRVAACFIVCPSAEVVAARGGLVAHDLVAHRAPLSQVLALPEERSPPGRVAHYL